MVKNNRLVKKALFNGCAVFIVLLILYYHTSKEALQPVPNDYRVVGGSKKSKVTTTDSLSDGASHLKAAPHIGKLKSKLDPGMEVAAYDTEKVQSKRRQQHINQLQQQNVKEEGNDRVQANPKYNSQKQQPQAGDTEEEFVLEDIDHGVDIKADEEDIVELLNVDNIPVGAPVTVPIRSMTREEMDRLDSVNSLVHVMIASDQKTIGGLVSLVNSIQKHAKTRKVFFHLVTLPTLVNYLKEWLLHHKLKLNMEIVPFSEHTLGQLKSLKLKKLRKELTSPLKFARLVIPDLLPKYNGKLIYLDDDVIVQDDINLLWDMPFDKTNSNSLIMASVDTDSTMDQILDYNSKRVVNSGLPKTQHPFNAGVFVCKEVKEWRDIGVSKELLEWVTINSDENNNDHDNSGGVYGREVSGSVSQPPMNIVFYNRISPLPDNWHVRNLGWAKGQKYDKKTVADAKLIHWNGKAKPWKYSSLSKKFSDIWYQYYLDDPGHAHVTGKIIQESKLKVDRV